MKKLRIISIFLVILLLFTACKADLTDGFGLGLSKKNAHGNKSLYLIGYNFENANPLLVKNEVNREIFSLIYDGLYTLDDKYTPVPKLAKDSTMSNDGLTWTITLNSEAHFHDGTSLSANDVVSTINYLLGNSTYYTYNVSKIKSVSQNGNNSVVITLNSPAQNFTSLLTFPIVNSKDLLSEFTFNGTGMFVVDNYIKRKYINLKPNENYYGKTNEEISKIEVQLMPDKETANYSYSSGLSDVFSQDIFKDASSLNPKTGSSSMEYVSLNYGFLLLNHNIPVFSDAEIRKAINLAVDKQRIVDDVLFSHAEAVKTPIPQKSGLWYEDKQSEYNVNKAKDILSQAGFVPDINTGILKRETENSNEELSFSILVNNDNNFRIQVANLISENLKYIGINATVKIVSYEEYELSYMNKSYEAFLGTVNMSPEFDLTMFMGDYNISNYYSVRAKETLDKISLAKNYEEKKTYYETLQTIFIKDVPHISLYYTKANLQHSDKIKKGLNPTGFNIFNNIENWSFEE